MKRRLLKYSILIFAIACTLILAYAYAHDIYINNQNNVNPEYLINNHPNKGYFKIESEKILPSLTQGDTDVFAPLLQEPDLVEPLENASFSWTQGDFLKIASALGLSVWNDPMSKEDWNISNIIFGTICQENPIGFHFAAITYFKEIETNGKRLYVTRHIEIDPYYSMIRWGGGATYPRPIMSKWKSFDLAQFRITAEDALQIADNHGGKEARQKVGDGCLIYVSPTINNKWFIDYGLAYYAMLIDPYNGSYEIFNTNQ